MLRQYLLLIFRYLLVFVALTENIVSTPTSAVQNDNSLIDVSKVVQNDLLSSESFEFSKRTIQLLQKIVFSEFPVVFFEAEFLQITVDQIGKISEAFDQILRQIQHGKEIYPRILVSFRCNNETKLEDVKLIRHKYVVGMTFSSILQASGDRRTPDVLKPIASFNDVMWSSSKPSLTSHASDAFLNFTKPAAKELVVGLSFEDSLLKSSLAISNFHEQGFFILKIPLQLQTNFIGSYEYFDKILSKFNVGLKNIFYQNQRTIPVFFRFHTLQKASSNLYPDETHINFMDDQLSENYNKELHTFVQHWNKEQQNPNILTIMEPIRNKEDCYVDHTNCSIIDAGTLPLTIPYVPNIRFSSSIEFYDLCTLKDVLMEFYHAGLTTVAFSSVLVNALIKLKPDNSQTLHCPFKKEFTSTTKKSVTIDLIIEFDNSLDMITAESTTNFLNYLSNQINIELITKSIILPSYSAASSPSSGTNFVVFQIVRSFRVQSFNCVGGDVLFTFANITTTLDNVLTKLLDDTETNCSNYFAFVKTIIWKVQFDFYELVHGNVEPQFHQITHQITTKLNGLKTVRELFKENYPNHDITLMISGWNTYDKNRNYEEPINTLYCTKDTKKISILYETIFTWARIHGFPVIIKQGHSPTFINPISWRRVDPYSEGDIIEDELPVMIRRRYNSTFAVGNSMAGAYSCLDLPEKVDKNGLNFDHGYSGITLNFNIKQKSGILNVTLEEIEIWLLLTLQKFNFIEIFAGSQQNLQNSLNIVQQVVKRLNFRRNLQGNQMEGRSILFDISIETLKDKVFLKNLLTYFSIIVHQANKLEIFTSVYFSNWNETQIEEDISLNIQSFQNAGVEVGLSVKKCGRAINQLFNMKKSTLSKLQILPFDKADYIICERNTDVSDIRGTSSNAAFLEGRLYVKKWMKLMFPNLKRIYFRLSSNLITEAAPGFEFQGDTENILKFFTNVNNFAKEYKTHFFLAPAFRSSEYVNTFSWWQISNFKELSNVSVYEEVQARFLNKDTWKPKMFAKENPKDSRLPVWVWISWSVFGLACIILILAVVVAVKIRKNSKLLSNSEIEEFLSGKQGAMTYGAFGESNEYVGAYNRDFEIQKEKLQIDTGKILGMGQFGVVYKAALSGYRKPVAVKTPNSTCSKEMFIGMLSEVKLLCYIGKHENLVGFLGSCTKDIDKLVLYVVMELCECGSLQSYLLKMKTILVYESRLSDMVRFSKEIAAGMEYVASKGIIHGDLAARNVLLDVNKTCKIGDFGLSRKLYEYQTYVKKKQEPLPWKWMAYEALKSMEFSTRSDVWSFGVTVWEIFSLGDTPYPGLSWTVDFVDELRNGLRMKKPEFASEEIYQLMLECWSIIPQDRPQFGDLLSFFRNLTPYENVIQ